MKVKVSLELADVGSVLFGVLRTTALCVSLVTVQRLSSWQTTRKMVPNFSLMRPHKRCWLILTAGRWPWKSVSAKECVTTHLPNQLALKMDGA
ncbi:hypothetical protein B9Z55_027841 [Caenorhabditis nigoni]|uniref:Uncharacterized protein n=1 Tax=Caenorhabditis nigoni TaxID=1611254 RepID=A0A2G5SDQ2_9PELO|nr:hypothetical protein B9Z55_027841 [Caenorhabditis nigoni]